MFRIVPIVACLTFAMPTWAKNDNIVECSDEWVKFVPYRYATVEMLSITYLLRKTDINRCAICT